MLDEKYRRRITENLNTAVRLRCDYEAIAEGTVLEIALAAIERRLDPDEAVRFADELLPETGLYESALFCRMYTEYRKNPVLEFIGEVFHADKPNGVIIPEIPRLELALDALSDLGMPLEREYGESFAHCAGDVEEGHNRYVLFPMRSPDEGRLRAFDTLRDRYGLTVHATISVPGTEDGEYLYGLCAVGFSEPSDMKNRLSFSADTDKNISDVLSHLSMFHSSIISVTAEPKNNNSRINATVDISGMSISALCGMCMYLDHVADVIIDGYYTEF